MIEIKGKKAIKLDRVVDVDSNYWIDIDGGVWSLENGIFFPVEEKTPFMLSMVELSHGPAIKGFYIIELLQIIAMRLETVWSEA